MIQQGTTDIFYKGNTLVIIYNTCLLEAHENTWSIEEKIAYLKFINKNVLTITMNTYTMCYFCGKFRCCQTIGLYKQVVICNKCIIKTKCYSNVKAIGETNLEYNINGIIFQRSILLSIKEYLRPFFERNHNTTCEICVKLFEGRDRVCSQCSKYKDDVLTYSSRRLILFKYTLLANIDNDTAIYTYNLIKSIFVDCE